MLKSHRRTASRWQRAPSGSAFTSSLNAMQVKFCELGRVWRPSDRETICENSQSQHPRARARTLDVGRSSLPTRAADLSAVVPRLSAVWPVLCNTIRVIAILLRRRDRHRRSIRPQRWPLPATVKFAARRNAPGRDGTARAVRLELINDLIGTHDNEDDDIRGVCVRRAGFSERRGSHHLT